MTDLEVLGAPALQNRRQSAEQFRKSSNATSIAVAGRELAVTWSDGHESRYPFGWLRRRCPCAGCRTIAARAVASATAGEARRAGGDDRIARLSYVGNYGVWVGWSDGHESGIYAFESLRPRCQCGACAERHGARATANDRRH